MRECCWARGIEIGRKFDSGFKPLGFGSLGFWALGLVWKALKGYF